ncbi:hypothetical protein P4H54_01705 [Paenibacillus graminis]|uniref:hypothetical protein n=1 Tax=Paenibacillus graminis TaxID=189425 RepID=UPI002DB669F6|nr:hypothetical protein [Paenibacillus graminis]MEC0167080.1 hypothetical protein [Paenibacillus graminis]
MLQLIGSWHCRQRARFSNLLEYIQVVVFRKPDGSRWRQLGQPLEREQKRLLDMFGMDESIYV